MWNTGIRHFVLTLVCITGLFALTVQLAAPVHAAPAGGQIIITKPSVNGQVIGHPGTAVHINGSGLTPDGSYNLYITTDNTKCTDGDPGTLGLQPFAPATVTVAGGAFSLDTTWPTSASTPQTPYSICAANSAALTGAKIASTNAFTVAQPVTLDVTPNSVAPGQTVTITGSNWLPPQQLNVSVVVGNSDAPALVANDNVQPDATGSFSIQLQIPQNATPRTYAIRAYATNETTMNQVKNDALTVAQAATPTPTATPSPTPTPSPTVTPTSQAAVAATPTPGGTSPTDNNGSSNNILNYVIFGIGGLGVLFVLIGIILLVVSTQPGSA